MTRTALIMAGGRGERMARSGVDRPKPLVTVAGLTLLEWNLGMVVRAGFDRVLVSVGAGDAEVREFVTTPLRAAAGRVGVTVDELVEDQPLGNIGASGLLAGSVDSLLVVFADNLTGVDLGRIYDDHLAGDADLTLAAHREPFAMPFGELTAAEADPMLLDVYVEKPTYEPLVASAVMVLGRRAIERAAIGEPIGISQLAQVLVDEGATVRLWRHDAPWVDVNDAAALVRAECLVAEHAEVFESAVRLDAVEPHVAVSS